MQAFCLAIGLYCGGVLSAYSNSPAVIGAGGAGVVFAAVVSVSSNQMERTGVEQQWADQRDSGEMYR